MRLGTSPTGRVCSLAGLAAVGGIHRSGDVLQDTTEHLTQLAHLKLKVGDTSLQPVAFGAHGHRGV